MVGVTAEIKDMKCNLYVHEDIRKAPTSIQYFQMLLDTELGRPVCTLTYSTRSFARFVKLKLIRPADRSFELHHFLFLCYINGPEVVSRVTPVAVRKSTVGWSPTL